MVRVAALLALALVLAGCGGGETPPSAGEAATVVPADARSFAVIRTDAGDEQARRAVELLGRLPAVAAQGLDLEGDVLAGLGDETVHATLAGGEHVWLTRPEDRERFEELLAGHDPRPVTREVEGWTAVARDEAALDALERDREAGALADAEAFRGAFDELPAEAVGHVWTSGRDEGPLRASVAAVQAEDDGFLLEGYREAAAEAEPYEAALLDRVPAGATVAASFHGREGLLDRLRLLPFLAALDREDLAAAVSGEGVIFLRPAGLAPELTLLAEVEDGEAATRAAAALLEGLGAVPRGPGTVQFGPLAIHYGARDGLLALTSSATGLGVLEPADASLRDDPRFERAAERAELGGETTGFIYLRGDELAPMLGVLGLLGGGQPPPELGENLAALGSVLLHGGLDGERQTFRGFVEIPER